MNKTRLKARIEARNLANAAILEYAPKILAAIAPLVGELMRTKEGYRSAKLQKALDGILCQVAGFPRIQCIVRPDTYWFRAAFCVSVLCADGGSVYDTQTVNLGEMDGRTLKSVGEAPTPACYRTDYTAEEILAAREEVSIAKAAVRDAERKLCFFGEFDN